MPGNKQLDIPQQAVSLRLHLHHLLAARNCISLSRVVVTLLAGLRGRRIHAAQQEPSRRESVRRRL